MDDALVIAFSQSAPPLDGVSDGDFLKSLAWSRSAPKPLVSAARQGDPAAFCRELLSGRLGSGPETGTKKSAGRYSREFQSLWSQHGFQESPRTLTLLSLLKAVGARAVPSKAKIGVRRKAGGGKTNGRSSSGNGSVSRRQQSQLVDWLEETAVDGTISPYELLILFELLLQAGRELPADVTWRLWRRSLTAAIQLSTCQRKSESGKPKAESRKPKPGSGLNSSLSTLDPRPSTLNPQLSTLNSRLSDQRLVLHGELPWEAGLLFGPVKGAEAFGRAGQRFLRQELLDRTDTDGTPQAELLENLALWLAPLVRASQWAKRFRVSLWDDEAEDRFRDLVRSVAPLCDADGRPALGNGLPCSLVGLLTSASKLAGWKRKRPPLNLLLALSTGGGKAGKRTGRQTKKSVPPPATQSDWARLACLRNRWSVDADTMVVAHHREKPMIDLSVLGKPLLSGVWEVDVTVDGEPLRFEDDWTCVCWHSDRDADYLELQATFGGRLRMERQLLLSRNDHFALLADSVSGAGRATLEYTSRLPLVDAVAAECDVSTRECILKARRQVARVFPLSLDQDRVHSTPGNFGPADDGGLELRQTAVGGLYAPVVIDWEPSRQRTEAVWRTLTVTEQRKILPRDVAAGHRLRIADHQLLLYHSLVNSEESRTVLGLHTFHETVVGKFDSAGRVSPIVLVE